jgi:PTH1 family peptidyl-tRNA hydrolase
MKLIVGLGNPGKKYEKTRHNAGFMALDRLHEKLKLNSINSWELSTKFNALISGCTINGEKILLAKPTTYMNRSGEAISLIMHFYKVSLHDLIVLHDDKDIPLGEIKTQSERGHAGHNGVRSIIDTLGTTSFTRIRLGIANPEKMGDVPTFVLKKFGLFEKKKVEKMLLESVDIVLSRIKS